MKLYRIIFYVIFAVGTVGAQNGEFSFRKEATDPPIPANAICAMQLRLFGTKPGRGAQQGPTATTPEVIVSDGSFSVAVELGTTPLAAGTQRYFEVYIRPAGSTGGYTAMAPRQILTPAPYSFRSLSTVAPNATTGAQRPTGKSTSPSVRINRQAEPPFMDLINEQLAHIEAHKTQNAELRREVEKLREIVRANSAQVDELRALIICRTTMRPELCGLER